jgi:hypothetical protein
MIFFLYIKNILKRTEIIIFFHNKEISNNQSSHSTCLPASTDESQEYQKTQIRSNSLQPGLPRHQASQVDKLLTEIAPLC